MRRCRREHRARSGIRISLSHAGNVRLRIGVLDPRTFSQRHTVHPLVIHLRGRARCRNRLFSFMHPGLSEHHPRTSVPNRLLQLPVNLSTCWQPCSSFAGVSRSIIIIDILQTLLFCLLRFNLIYSPVTRDHFRDHHLLIGQIMALFLFLIPLTGCVGAASRAESSFLRTLSCFLGLRLITFFLANQVSYTWLHYVHCSLWDVPGEALLAGFALYLLYTSHSVDAKSSQIAPLRTPGVLVRSLMPSFLTLVNLVLGLIVLRISVPLATVTISLSLLGYMARTVLLQTQAQAGEASPREPQPATRRPRHARSSHRHRQSPLARRSLQPSASAEDDKSLASANGHRLFQAGQRPPRSSARRQSARRACQKAGKPLPPIVAGGHCARFGGDEFALLLLNVTPQKASVLAEELRVLFSAHTFEAETAK